MSHFKVFYFESRDSHYNCMTMFSALRIIKFSITTLVFYSLLLYQISSLIRYRRRNPSPASTELRCASDIHSSGRRFRLKRHQTRSSRIPTAAGSFLACTRPHSRPGNYRRCNLRRFKKKNGRCDS